MNLFKLLLGRILKMEISNETYFSLKTEHIYQFKQVLYDRENASATIRKYITDIRTFYSYLGDNKQINKQRILLYKEWLMEHYAITSVNSMLVALNQFLNFLNLEHLKTKQIRIQNNFFIRKEKELTKVEYENLVKTAQSQGKEQLALIMETICSTGIRISELNFFTVEAVKLGVAKVWNKGKYRLVLIPNLLQKKLNCYAKKKQIQSGIIFKTKSGKPKDRSNIWREMKKIAELAGISPEKIFPHNLRHLFARTFYCYTKDLVNLADILGHSSLDITRIYTSEGIEASRKNIDKLQLIITI